MVNYSYYVINFIMDKYIILPYIICSKLYHINSINMILITYVLLLNNLSIMICKPINIISLTTIMYIMIILLISRNYNICDNTYISIC